VEESEKKRAREEKETKCNWKRGSQCVGTVLFLTITADSVVFFNKNADYFSSLSNSSGAASPPLS
jgi:hypothetical protein